MSAALIVTLNSRQTDKVILDRESFIIGRSRRCDLALEDKNVSREHAIITEKSGVYSIRDRGSRNGTLVNGSPITGQETLKEGDRIGIGPYELQFLEAAPRTRAAEESAESRTRFMDPDDGRKKKGRKTRARTPGRLQYRVTVTDGPLKGTTIKEWEDDLTIGRGTDNKLILPDDAVSVSHARIRQDDGLFYVEDLGSSNGTFVDGVRIQTLRLKNNSRVRIGGTTMVFTVADPEKRRFTAVLTAVSGVFAVVLAVVVVLLMPEDNLSPMIAQGDEYLRQGNYAAGKDTFEKILQAQPDHQYAARQLGLAKDLLEREATLSRAREAAENERYDVALDICSQLLRKSPKYKSAKELEGVIALIKDAQVAVDARNWPDAVRLLSKARETYSKSSLLIRRLERAQSEMSFEQAVARAKEFLAHDQQERARELLVGIPETSVYCPEAQGLLQGMRKADTVTANAETAETAYRDGALAEAMAEIDKGLKVSPGDARLASLRAHIGEMTPLIEKVRQGGALVESKNIPAIRDMIESCSGLIGAEPDRRNRFRNDTAKLRQDLELALGEIERDAMEKADGLAEAGNRKEAYKFYVVAAQANPENERAAKAAEDISAEVVAQCQSHFREGLVHEELGQTDMAIEAYEKVIGLAIEGDAYYDRAKAKLQALKR